jgi:hypothetical protein
MPERHGAIGPVPDGELDGGGGVERAGVEVVRSPVADPQQGDAGGGELHAEAVIEAVGRAEEAPHRPTAGDDGRRLVASAVPQDGQQTAHGVQLQVAEARHDLHLAGGEHGQRLERRGAGAFPAAVVV